MAIRLRFENQFSSELEAELEVDTTLSGFVLCDELWICRNAMENLSDMGRYHALPFYNPNYSKSQKPPQTELMKHFLK